MNNKFGSLLILFLLSASIAFAQKKSTDLYLSLDQFPNAVNYLPAPPDTASLSFVDDFNQYLWGKTQRNNPKRVE